MGSVASCCCPNTNEDEDEPQSSETARLLTNGQVQKNSGRQGQRDNTRDYQAQQRSLAHDENDEQSLLSRILTQTASNIIDVAAVDSHGVEPHEYAERHRKYNEMLKQLSVTQNVAQRRDSLVTDTQHVERVLSLPPVAEDHLTMVRTFAHNMSQAMHDVHVEHREELVVHFGLPSYGGAHAAAPLQPAHQQQSVMV